MPGRSRVTAHLLANREVVSGTCQIFGGMACKRRSRSYAPQAMSLHGRLHAAVFVATTARELPEERDGFKTGIAHVAKRHPEVPIFLHGLGKALPRDEGILVPFFCDVFVDEALAWTGDRVSFIQNLDQRMADLAHEFKLAAWV